MFRYLKLTISLLAILSCFVFAKNVSAATEFISIVDTGGAGDYSTLSSWEQFNQTNLTLATTQVFSGTRTNDIADGGITVYLCRSGVYQSHSGTVVHATTSQILIETITGSATEQANDIWYTNNSCDSANYFTLSGAQAGGDSAISVASCQASAGGADQTAVEIDGWTTSDTNYIKVYTTTANRHDGVWDTGKYRIELTNTNIISISEKYVRIEGLQIKLTSWQDNKNAIWINDGAGAGDIRVSKNIVKGVCSGSTRAYGIRSYSSYSKISVWNNVVYDFIATGSTDDEGIILSTKNIGQSIAYSNTVFNCYHGIAQQDHTIIAKNNIVQNCTDGYFGTFDASSTNNITETSAEEGAWGTAADSGTTTSASANKLIETGQNFQTTVKVGMIVKDSGTNYSYVTTIDSDTQLSLNDDIMGSGETYTIYTNMYGSVSFADESGDDFHLGSSDTLAMDNWSNVYADGNLAVTDDIDGAGRPNSSLGDIGADEYPVSIYRSVGPSASSYLEKGIDGGGNDLNISGSTATFALDLGTDVGVGDVIQYDDDNDGDIDVNDSVAFIHARASATSFTVKNSTGGAPTATAAADQDWSIFRSYSSLANAESGAENSGIDADLADFDTWSGGKDIVTSNEQWNIACYNGQGDAADQTAVTINDWTTGANNYIKVYTPTETTEVGTTQRHSGVWDSGKYILEMTNEGGSSLRIKESNVKIDGLQVSHSGDYNGREGIRVFNSGDTGIEISNCIVKIEGTNGASSICIKVGDMTNAKAVKIWNCIMYNPFNTGFVSSEGGISDSTMVYNCTAVDCANYGFVSYSHKTIWKNNVAFNCTTSGFNTAATPAAGSTHNASDDGSAPDTNEVDISGYAGTDLFNDYNNDDFHLKSGSALVDAGADLSSDGNLSFSDDIDSDSRPSPYWDIGADEYPASRKVRFEGDFKMEGDFKIE